MIARGASYRSRIPTYEMAKKKGSQTSAKTSAPKSHNQQDGSPSKNAAWQQPQPQLRRESNRQQGEHLLNKAMANVDIYQIVDSWRSYRNDQTNLQTATNPTPAYNPMAMPFAPASVLPPLPQVPMNQWQSPSHQFSRYANSARTYPNFGNIRQFHSTGVNTFPQAYPTNTFGNFFTPNPPSFEIPVPSIEVENSNTFLPRDLNASNNVSGRRPTPRHAVPPPPAPKATESYIAQANKLPTTKPASKKLLVILDLNGTLLFRPSRGAHPTTINMRPGVTPLLEYLFENHLVMIYSSAQPNNVAGMLNKFISPLQNRKLAAVWARDKLDLTQAQYREKVQVYKKLDKVWADPLIQSKAVAGTKWDQTNTVLVDDSRLKALAQPHNLLQVPEYTRTDNPSSPTFTTPAERARASKIQQDILKQLEMKLEVLKWQDDVSGMIRLWQTGKTPVPRVPGQEIVVEETVDQKETTQSQKDQQQHVSTHLPTPTSTSAEEDDIEIDMDLSNSDSEGEEPDRVVGGDGGAPLSPAVSAADSDPTMQDLTERIPGLGKLDDSPNEGGRTARSVSPIDPSIWKEILEGKDSSNSNKRAGS